MKKIWVIPPPKNFDYEWNFNAPARVTGRAVRRVVLGMEGNDPTSEGTAHAGLGRRRPRVDEDIEGGKAAIRCDDMPHERTEGDL